MSRAYWLARPWFLASVAVLAINDHLLKGVAPGWLTGKLSDFAGLVVVTTLISVLLGRSAGVAAAAVGFTALKLVPGVAELVAPILGGVTLRDASDLIALVVLPGLWVLLGRSQRRAASPRRALQIVGLVAGVLVTTATIDRVPPQTEDYLEKVGWTRDGAFYLEVDKVGDNVDYLRSSDGGRSWQEATRPGERWLGAGEVDPATALPSPTSHSMDQIIQECADDGVCYRTRARDIDSLPGKTVWETVVQRRVPGGDWVTEVTFADDAKYRFDDFAVNLADSDQLVGLVDHDRVMYRDVRGRYTLVKVLG